MSRQCLSASGAGRALTPARHLRLGKPSPYQLANTTWAPPGAPELCSPEVIRYYPPSRTAIPDPGVGTHALLPLTPVPPLLGFPRLACLIHAANVRSEPGSNPSKVYWLPFRGCFRESIRPPDSQTQRTRSGRPGPRGHRPTLPGSGPAVRRPIPTPILTTLPLVKDLADCCSELVARFNSRPGFHRTSLGRRFDQRRRV